MFKKLWNDEAGVVVSTELIVVTTLLVIGLAAGWSSVRDAVLGELADLGQAFGNLDQSYVLRGTMDCSSVSASSGFVDRADFCDGDDSSQATNSRGVVVSGQSPRTVAVRQGEYQGPGELPRPRSLKARQLGHDDGLVLRGTDLVQYEGSLR